MEITCIDALPADVWAYICNTLSNLEVCSLAASNKACWKFSCGKRSLKVELDADQDLQYRLASLLHFLTNRHKYMQVARELLSLLLVCLLKACEL